MPPIASTKEELDGLKNLVVRSVVVLIRSKNGNYVEFGTGFVIFANRRRALICVEKSLIRDDETITVRFHDNSHRIARVFFQKTISRHAVLQVDSSASLNLCPVTFNESEVTREDIFTVAAVHREGRLGLMTGAIGAISGNGDPVYRSDGTFSFSCPLPGRSKIPREEQGRWDEPEEFARMIGAAVFDMSGMVIGTVDTSDPRSDSIKFGIKTSFFLDKLETSLKAKDKKIYLQRGGRGFGQGSSSSRNHDTTSETASRKRQHANTPRGGMGTEKTLRMTQLEGTAEVVNKKQLRLHKYPVQGDMDGLRRESFERALIRLVTKEADDALRSSSSPLARNPGEVGTYKSIGVEPFDLNQFFGRDVKIYNYKSLKNGTTDQVEKIIKSLNDGQIASTDIIEVLLCSSYVLFPIVKDKLRPEIQVAAQNCCVKKGGVFKGEVSAEMPANLGIPWVILARSERRSLLGESSEFVGDKVAYALAQGLKVIACVGETLEQRGAGSTMDVVAKQTKAIADKINDWTNVVIAYEPVWAIGTGKVATPAQAQEVHANLRDWLKTNVSPEVAKSTKIVYGGSVTCASASELAAQPDIDGFLIIDGASLKSELINAPIVKSV